MQADHTVRTARLLGDLGDREGTGVGGEDHVGAGNVVERPEDRPLQSEILHRGFDHEVGVIGQGVDGRDVPDPLEPRPNPFVGGLLVEVEFHRSPRQAIADPVATCRDGRFIDVEEDDLAAGLERHLADPGAHRPGTDDADDRRQVVTAPRRRRLGHQTDLIDSNGWRQSVQ
jgi:hypothetical protein